MKKVTITLLCFLGVAVFLICGKVYAEQTVSSGDASAEVPEANRDNLSDSKALSGDTLPVAEELKDEEVVDSDA